ncbi:MAG: DUF6311 domain-containing protein [Bacilli bacterium]|nr:DUF6311 domain-containing protein [Bacilli bacterium]
MVKEKKEDSKNKIIKKLILKHYNLIIIILSIFIFASAFTFQVINPFNVRWLEKIGKYGFGADILQHYIGWEGYRFSSWTFPIGLSNSLSYPHHISVIFTDAIPICAFIFKIFSFLLPKKFQYLGLYGVSCYILQALTSSKIIKKYTDSKLLTILISILFIYSPIMIFRMFYHTSLCSHWLILISLSTLFLYEEYEKNKKIYITWMIISFLCSTIHIYLLAMCGIILIGYILLDILNTKKITKSIKLLITYLVIATITTYIFGGFHNISKIDNEGLGYFSFNLNGFLNPLDWSSYTKTLPMIEGQYEGFAYLGLGLLILIAISVVLLIITLIKDRNKLIKYKNLSISLLFISIICIIFALSPKAYYGDKLLYNLKLPNFINDIWGIFRSTGRFIWPVVYIITICSLIIIIKRLSFKKAVIILIICLYIQITEIGETLSNTYDYYTFLNSKEKPQEVEVKYDLDKYPYIKQLAKNKDTKILYLASKDFNTLDIYVYSDWALNHGLKTNLFWFSRNFINDYIFSPKNLKIKKTSKNNLYLFTTKNECKSYKLHCYELPNNHYLGYIKELDKKRKEDK